MTHYHVMAGFHGCLPEYNTVYNDKAIALQAFAEFVKDSVEALGTKFTTVYQDRENGEVVVDDTNQTSTYYIEVFPCTDCEEGDYSSN